MSIPEFKIINIKVELSLISALFNLHVYLFPPPLREAFRLLTGLIFSFPVSSARSSISREV